MHGVGEYYCIDTIIKSHAVAYHLYKDNYFRKYGGKIGITLNSRYFFSTNNNTDLVNQAMQFWVYSTKSLFLFKIIIEKINKKFK